MQKLGFGGLSGGRGGFYSRRRPPPDLKVDGPSLAPPKSNGISDNHAYVVIARNPK